MHERTDEAVRLLIAPGETPPEALAALVREGLSELGSPVEFVLAEQVPATGVDAEGEVGGGTGADAGRGNRGAQAVAAALSHYERQGSRLHAAAAIVHGSDDLSLAATISLVKLGVPVAALGTDLPALLADHRLTPGDGLQRQVAEWLRRILPA